MFFQPGHAVSSATTRRFHGIAIDDSHVILADHRHGATCSRNVAHGLPRPGGRRHEPRLAEPRRELRGADATAGPEGSPGGPGGGRFQPDDWAWDSS